MRVAIWIVFVIKGAPLEGSEAIIVGVIILDPSTIRYVTIFASSTRISSGGLKTEDPWESLANSISSNCLVVIVAIAVPATVVSVVTGMIDVGVTPKTGGSVGVTPETGGSVGVTPETSGSVGVTTETGGGVGVTTETGGSVGCRVDAGMSVDAVKVWFTAGVSVGAGVSFEVGMSVGVGVSVENSVAVNVGVKVSVAVNVGIGISVGSGSIVEDGMSVKSNAADMDVGVTSLGVSLGCNSRHGKIKRQAVNISVIVLSVDVVWCSASSVESFIWNHLIYEPVF
jgi:hypothetical protein